MNSLTSSQVVLCNEIVSVILINDLCITCQQVRGSHRLYLKKDKQTRAETDLDFFLNAYVVFHKGE